MFMVHLCTYYISRTPCITVLYIYESRLRIAQLKPPHKRSRRRTQDCLSNIAYSVLLYLCLCAYSKVNTNKSLIKALGDARTRLLPILLIYHHRENI